MNESKSVTRRDVVTASGAILLPLGMACDAHAQAQTPAPAGALGQAAPPAPGRAAAGGSGQGSIWPMPLEGEYFYPPEGNNKPMGVGKGIHPGRVAWKFRMKKFLVAGGSGAILVLVLLTSRSVASAQLENVPTDFLNWTSDGVPIISTGTTGTFDSRRVEEPSMIQNGKDIYVFYAAWDANYAGSIGVASGESLKLLKKNASPVLSASVSGWDSGYVSGPRVVEFNGVYYMYYYGSPNTGFEATPGSIGVATSSDLIHWKKYEHNPILTPGPSGSWDSASLCRSFVLEWQGTYYLFYNGGSGSIEEIGYATAPTPLGPWTKYPGKPVLTVDGAGTWDSHCVGDPWIMRFSSGWVMFFYGGDTADYTGNASMGLAYSANLSTWTKYNANPLSISGFVGNHDKPSVMKLGSRYIMTFDNGGALAAGGRIGGSAIFAAYGTSY